MKYRIGLDVGSTTAKVVVTDVHNRIVFSSYERHNADVTGVVGRIFRDLSDSVGDSSVSVCITGSVGMGLSERFSASFVQEVVAAAEYVKKMHPEISTIIDIGGEDAKVVYLRPDGNADLRMNGNCAGGTGAFIDQMAQLLGVVVEDMDVLASKTERIYPIASRCGVFSKTDVQNLVSKNVSKADIAASIFHAVAVQTVITLSRGTEIKPKVLFCGGPLTFIPSLRKAFIKYLKMREKDFVLPEHANLIPAWGAALSANEDNAIPLSKVITAMCDDSIVGSVKLSNRLAPIFTSEEQYEEWKERKSRIRIEEADLLSHSGPAYLGIDSGSTTTKIAVTDDSDRLLYSYYASNGGNPIQTIREGLSLFARQCKEAGVELAINGSCSTGYGEDLIKAAFGLRGGVIETIAHYVAARKVDPEVSFILDIGGQDMKAIFIENGVLNRMEINEACSSGCGSFIETFAGSLKYSVGDFARAACLAENPCDLGTRCTVFMNSKVKQVLREGAPISDIAAGLTYSVVKNCLYKVLKLKKNDDLGQHIVVQGGTMRNDSVVGALEQLAGVEVGRSNMPELMGAYGCALFAKSELSSEEDVTIAQLLAMADYSTRQIQCRGCENLCYVHKYTFGGGVYYSGNKCEKVFSNRGSDSVKGRNLSVEKYTMLFDRAGRRNEREETPASNGGAIKSALTCDPHRKPIIGIPRALNMYENYPFWHAMFEACGIETVLSSPSTYRKYEEGVHTVMSDNICFPAKLMHSHIYDLTDRLVDRIFFPYVVFERNEGEGGNNSYNCPVVSGYSELIKSAIVPSVPVDAPVINFKDEKMLMKGCVGYLTSIGIDKAAARKAVSRGLEAQSGYEQKLCRLNKEVYEQSRTEGKLTILLAGRPYHADPLIQHKLSDMIADMGATVITEDIVRGDNETSIKEVHVVSQWAYINRIIRAAQWVADHGDDVHFVQMTSFGCGPDAFLLDEVRQILSRHGKSPTFLKIDDVNNIGSIKLRVRSVVESLRFEASEKRRTEPFRSTRVFTKDDRQRTLLVPYFTDYISPLIPSILELSGYRAVPLPKSDTVSAEYGLMYANNEVCYPATLIVGDIIKALDSGRYDLSRTAAIITQTGGQCRATNYIALIKRGLIEAGYEDVPVLSLAFGSGLVNEQSGFNLPWLKIINVTMAAIFFGDCISKFYYPSAVRERFPGDAARLRGKYLDEAKKLILKNDTAGIYALIKTAAKEFNSIIVPRDGIPRVGVVGEIFLKFNSFAHKGVVDWLVEQKIEVMPPALVDFFMQSFVNRKVRNETNLQKKGKFEFVMDALYGLIRRKMKQVNGLASEFVYFEPFHDIFHAAENGREIITLNAQFGEGWLLPAEVVGFAKQGVDHVISLQPFGCIANHIVSKGMEKKIKSLYPQMNLLALDFDSGVSDVNILNRLMLLTNNLKKDERHG